MGNLVFPLTAIPSRGVGVHQTVPEEVLRPEGDAQTALRSVNVDGVLEPVGEEFLFRGTLVGNFESPCDRCLAPAGEAMALRVAWMFERGPNKAGNAEAEHAKELVESAENEEEVRYFDEDKIDLGPPVWEEFLLAKPSKYYCTEKCKGLCPSCGANWNEGPCTCNETKEQTNSGLAALKDMFPDLPPGPSEE